MTRVFLVDQLELVRTGLRLLLEGIAGIDVVGDSGSAPDAGTLTKLSPDVVLLDVPDPIEPTTAIAPHARILILAAQADREIVRLALRAGANGYLLKSASRGELETAIATVARGDVWLSPAVAHGLVDDIRARDDRATNVLTPRQLEVLRMIAEGNSTREIAKRLVVSIKTVETHRSQIMERLDIHNVAGLVRYAIQTRLVTGK